MNKKFVAGAGVTLFALALTAKDPVIMTVNGVDVPKSEFEYLYGKIRDSGGKFREISTGEQRIPHTVDTLAFSSILGRILTFEEHDVAYLHLLCRPVICLFKKFFKEYRVGKIRSGKIMPVLLHLFSESRSGVYPFRLGVLDFHLIKLKQ